MFLSTICLLVIHYINCLQGVRVPLEAYDNPRILSRATASFDVSPRPPNPLLSSTSPSGPPFPIPICGLAPPSCIIHAYRTFNGSCNNIQHPDWGMTNTKFRRLLPPIYCDGISTTTCSVSGQTLPNARLVSSVVFGDTNLPDPNFTLALMQWGQAIVHDMSRTPFKRPPVLCCSQNGSYIEVPNGDCHRIDVPPNDPVYSEAGVECFAMLTSIHDGNLNCNYHGGPEEQMISSTSYMDLSLVYGNTIEENRVLRAFVGGRMTVEERNGRQWPPQTTNANITCDMQDENAVCFLTGDIRCNQNPGILVLHTLLLREHNRIADALAKLNPHWTDRIVFEEARKINIGQVQHINYYEWMPNILGREHMIKARLIYNIAAGSHVNDYDPSIDPSVLNEHATAAIRSFHSQVQGKLDLVSESGSITGSLRLSDWFNRPSIVEVDDNLDSLARGLVTQNSALADSNFDKEIKQYAFRGVNTLGLDLIMADIQSGRYHGVASYNSFREFCGLKSAFEWEDFEDLIEPEIVKKLKSVYETPDDVDLFVGGSTEAKVNGSLTGPTFLCILTEQFYRTRVGDRYFYENADKITGFNSEQLEEIRKSSLARLLCDNVNSITSIQASAFLSVSTSNPIVPCSTIPRVDLSKWADKSPTANVCRKGHRGVFGDDGKDSGMLVVARLSSSDGVVLVLPTYTS